MGEKRDEFTNTSNIFTILKSETYNAHRPVLFTCLPGP
jgi:hypothetical protein